MNFVLYFQILNTLIYEIKSLSAHPGPDFGHSWNRFFVIFQSGFRFHLSFIFLATLPPNAIGDQNRQKEHTDGDKYKNDFRFAGVGIVFATSTSFAFGFEEQEQRQEDQIEEVHGTEKR